MRDDERGFAHPRSMDLSIIGCKFPTMAAQASTPEPVMGSPDMASELNESENGIKSPMVSNERIIDADDVEKRLRRKVDIRLCTIAGLLCSLNLLDSGLISSASVTSMLSDLGLDQGNRFSVSILIFTVSGVCFQLPATIAVRVIGPRIFFSFVTFGFGLISLVRVLLLVCYTRLKRPVSSY